MVKILTMDQATQDQLNQYFASINNTGQATLPFDYSYANNPTMRNATGGFQQNLAEQQLNNQILNYSNPNQATNSQPIYLGPSSNLTSAISPDNPYYSYFSNLVSQNPGAVHPGETPGTQALYINAGGVNGSASMGANGQLDIPQDILNPASGWNETHYGGIPNSSTYSAPGDALNYANQQYADSVASTQKNQQSYLTSNKGLPLLGQILSYAVPAGIGLLTGGLGAGLGAASGLAGGATLGAAAGGALGSIPGSYATTGQSPSALTALESGAGSAAGSLAGQYFPETMDAINPFSGSAGNVAPNMGAPNSLGGSTANAAADSLTPNFFQSTFGDSSANIAPPGSSSTSIPNPTNANISGAGNSSSLFDKAGDYIANNPLTTATGVLAAGAGISNALSSPTTPTSNLGSALSSFTPTQQPGLAAPSDLANYTNSALSPDQTLSGIATKGVYGGGLGPDEQKYFLNLVNNRLVDPTGKVANDTSSLNPVENSYLSQLGLGGYSNPTDLLKGISNYAP